jgi:hypothetical protein
MKIPTSVRATFAALGMIAVATTACSDSTSPPATAQIRFLHAALGVDAVDFRVDDTDALTGVEFVDEISAYGSVPAGSRKLAVRLTGEDEDLVSPTEDLTAGAQYTAVLINGIDSQILGFYADTNTAAADGKTMLRIINTSQVTGLLDVYVTEPDAELDDAEPVITELSMPAASKYVEVASGEQRIRFTEAGTKTVVFDAGSIELPDTGVRTVFLVDSDAGDPPLQAIVAEDRG